MHDVSLQTVHKCKNKYVLYKDIETKQVRFCVRHTELIFCDCKITFLATVQL